MGFFFDGFGVWSSRCRHFLSPNLSFIRSVSSRDGWSVSKSVRPNIESHRSFDHHPYTVFSLSCTLSELNNFSLRDGVIAEVSRVIVRDCQFLYLLCGFAHGRLNWNWVGENRHHNLWVSLNLVPYCRTLNRKFSICAPFIINLLGCTRRRKNWVKKFFLVEGQPSRPRWLPSLHIFKSTNFKVSASSSSSSSRSKIALQVNNIIGKQHRRISYKYLSAASPSVTWTHQPSCTFLLSLPISINFGDSSRISPTPPFFCSGPSRHSCGHIRQEGLRRRIGWSCTRPPPPPPPSPPFQFGFCVVM